MQLSNANATESASVKLALILKTNLYCGNFGKCINYQTQDDDNTKVHVRTLTKQPEKQ